MLQKHNKNLFYNLPYDMNSINNVPSINFQLNILILVIVSKRKHQRSPFIH